MAALMSALRAVPAAMKMAGKAHSAISAVGRSTPSVAKALTPTMTNALSAMKGVTKGNASLSNTMSSLSRAAPHVSALMQNKGIASNIYHGFKAAGALHGAARELSKMLSPSGASHSSASGEGNKKQPESGQAKPLKFMVGRPIKNWEQATAKNGFHEIGSHRKGSSESGGAAESGQGRSRFKIMVGRPVKNWEQATAENGFHEIGGHRKDSAAPGQSGSRMKIMASVVKNWEHATPENGFHELNMRSANKSISEMRTHLSLSFGGSKGPGSNRVGELSMSLHGSKAASSSRKRANAFSEGSGRKGSGGDSPFQALTEHISSMARERSTATGSAKSAHLFSMTIGFGGGSMSFSIQARGGLSGSNSSKPDASGKIVIGHHRQNPTNERGKH